MSISGLTRLIVVIADPVAQVRSVGLLNEQLVRDRVDVVVVPAQVPAAGLADFAAAARHWRNLAGILVSIPHKIAVCALVDELTPRAAASGSANVVRREETGRLRADSTDGLGFVRNLAHHGIGASGRRVLVVGAGGAARAVASALAAAGATTVDLSSRSPERTAAAVEAIGHRRVCAVTAAPEIGDYDLLVNATPLGLGPGDPLPFDPARARADAVVCDIVMPATESALVSAARRRGLVAIDGGGMLRHQLLENARFVLDVASVPGPSGG